MERYRFGRLRVGRGRVWMFSFVEADGKLGDERTTQTVGTPVTAGGKIVLLAGGMLRPDQVAINDIVTLQLLLFISALVQQQRRLTV